MTSIRLPENIERELEQISDEQHVSKTSIIKKAISEYIDTYHNSKSAFEIGNQLFGNYGNGKQIDSTTYKDQLKGKIDAKSSH